MTTNDFDRTAQSWLEEGPTVMPERGLQAALDEIHVTRQRRAWWPAWRFSSMGIAVRVAAGVAAVLVVALVGINLFASGNGGVGGPAPSPTPTPSPTPSPTPLALRVGSETSSLEPGTYVIADPFLVQVTASVPAGWTGHIGGPYFVDLEASSGGGVSLSIFEKVYADPCHFDKGLLDPLPGPTVDDLATALAKLPGLSATTPTDVTVAGYQGKQLTLTAPASFAGCTLSPDGYLVWELPLGGSYFMNPNERDRVWILDVNGQRLVIDVRESPGQTAQDKAEVQGVLDSLRVAPATVTPSATP